jgi:hypothetical protein
MNDKREFYMQVAAALDIKSLTVQQANIVYDARIHAIKQAENGDFSTPLSTNLLYTYAYLMAQKQMATVH